MKIKFNDPSQTTFAFKKDAAIKISFKGTVDRTVSDVPIYNGYYTVVPDVEDQTLPTSGKVASKDITVTKIPLYEVRNESGGDTLIIGGKDTHGN